MITGKGRIRESTGNGGSGRVPKMWDPGEYRECGIRASTKKVKSGCVSEIGDLGEYRKCGNPGEYRKCMMGSERVSKKVKSGRVPEKDGILASIGNV